MCTKKLQEKRKATKAMVQSHPMQTAKIVKNRERTWKKYKQQHHWMVYTMERNRYIQLVHYFKKQSISKRVLDCEKDIKKFFHLVNKLMGNTTQNPLSPNKTDEELAEDFAKFFLSKIEKIREKFINTPAKKPAQ